jgi:hypothetical protein
LHHPMVQGQRASACVAGGVGVEEVELEHGGRRVGLEAEGLIVGACLQATEGLRKCRIASRAGSHKERFSVLQSVIRETLMA